MTADYTPTTDDIFEIFEEYIFDLALETLKEKHPDRFVHLSGDACKEAWADAKPAFDRWLASVKAEAWDAGFRAGHAHGFGDGTQPDQRTNPYREQETP